MGSWLRHCWSCLFLGLVLSCGRGEPTDPSTQGPVSISFSVTSLSFASLGESAQITATARNASGGTVSIALVWTSNNTSIASVSSSGLVTAAGNGSTTITATAGSASSSVPVTVLQVPATVSLLPTTLTLTFIGETAPVTATVKDAQGTAITNQQPTWSSSNPTIASVSNAGLVTANSAGSAQISATLGSAIAGIPVIVSLPAHTITPSAPTLTFASLQTTQPLSATVRDQQGTVISGAPVTWSSANGAVATVNSAGVVTSVGNGQTILTARSGGATATVSATVAQVVQTVAITGGSPTLLGINSSFTLSAAALDGNARPVAGATITWSTSNPAVAVVNATGTVTAVGNGTADIRATSGAVVALFRVEVVAFRRVAVDPYLATPIANALWVIPVVLVAYIPSADGVNLDVTKSPDFYTLGPMTLAAVEARILDIVRRKKMALEQGSRFRAYQNASAQPSIGIRVVDHLIVYNQIPTTGQQLFGVYTPDYKKAFLDLGLNTLIPQQGIKQVWLANSTFDAGFPSYNPAIHNLADTRWFPESNMASPTTGDISNSHRIPDDLPIFGHTYVVYGINFRREEAQAIHNVGHQLEAIFSHVNNRYEGNTRLFWQKFVGLSPAGTWVKGRAGATHFPPNADQDYDYLNANPVSSDIEDWRPDGTGARKPVNVNTWGSRALPWPGAANFPGRVESQWYIHWFQSMPGLNNTIPLNSGVMTNWWRFFADWDATVNAGTGLATVRDGVPIAIRNDFLPGSILLIPGGELAPGQTVVLYADAPIEVGVWDCGQTTSCIVDKYMLAPGKSYRVIQHPSGPVNNVTIVEQ